MITEGKHFQVLKFGGTSVADATAMSRALDIVEKARENGPVVMVCSAISGCTDALLRLAAKAQESADRNSIKEEARSLLNRHLGIIRRLFTGEEREEISSRITALFEEMSKGDPSLFETYGELFSTTILAAKLRCEAVRTLWIDSRELVITSDGEVDKKTSYGKIRKIVSDHPDTEVFVAPGFIASDTEGNVCTLGRGGSDYTAALFAAATNADKLLIFTDVPGIMTANPKDVRRARTIPEMSYETAFKLADHGAKVLYAPAVEPARESGITINILDTFHPSVPGTEVKAIAPKRHGSWVGAASGRVKNADGISQICIAADGPVDMEAAEEVRARLERTGITPEGFSTEEGDSLIFNVPEKEEKEALRICHKLCFETDKATDLYIAGMGKVGKALLEAISRTGQHINIRLISMHENEDEAFFTRMLQDETDRKKVFVDCTDSETIHEWYVPVLEAGISIVSSNRRALSVPYCEYSAMKKAARLHGCTLRYETTVGAALPVLDSINMSANSAEDIVSIEAVVSCTLNYILTSGLTFDEALSKAQSVGLTEKDPRSDLEGRDALRKLLILGREAGIPLEAEDVEIEPVDASSPALKGIRSGNVRFVATIDKDASAPKGYRASISLREVSPEDPAYSVKGTDNMISIRSAFHPTPLIIMGAGEGANMAASGVLNDILR